MGDLSDSRRHVIERTAESYAETRSQEVSPTNSQVRNCGGAFRLPHEETQKLIGVLGALQDHLNTSQPLLCLLTKQLEDWVVAAHWSSNDVILV